ncbi:hypothetical protein AB0948_30305 [Streptomyces koyangensis]|uniref:hypothetical protein n=1 Tax=Streptomyces koyangensis TaxID=188770 RepID=UPI0034514CE4
MPASEADDLEAGVVAGAQSQVVELDGMAPRSRGPVFRDGWREDVTTGSEALPWSASRTGTGTGAAAGPLGPLNWPYTSRT